MKLLPMQTDGLDLCTVLWRMLLQCWSSSSPNQPNIPTVAGGVHRSSMGAAHRRCNACSLVPHCIRGGDSLLLREKASVLISDDDGHEQTRSASFAAGVLQCRLCSMHRDVSQVVEVARDVLGSASHMSCACSDGMKRAASTVEHMARRNLPSDAQVNGRVCLRGNHPRWLHTSDI
jgi:hypothetical protein